MAFWNGKRVLITGGTGFIGSFAAEHLVKQGAQVTVTTRSKAESCGNLALVKDKVKMVQADLTKLEDCTKACKGQDAVMNLAATVGGIEYNIKNPATIFRTNMEITLNMMEAARICDVERYQAVSSVCVYPRFPTIPTPEADGFRDWPEPTNDGYGWAKRMAEFSAMTYARQYGMKVSIPRPANAYGPRDHFEPHKSHVVPALIKRVCDGEDPLVVWGDGSQTRSFLYVTDFAAGLALALEKYPQPDPINIGSDEETSVKQLIGMILEFSGRRPKVVYDTSKPTGQPRRKIDPSKALEKIGFKAKVTMRQGLPQTIEYYENVVKAVKK